jgi:hypothetical protein
MGPVKVYEKMVCVVHYAVGSVIRRVKEDWLASRESEVYGNRIRCCLVIPQFH